MDLRAIYTSMKFGTNPYIQKACYMHKPEPVIRVLADAIKTEFLTKSWINLF